MYGISGVATMPYGNDSSMALLGGDLNGLVGSNYNGFNAGFTGYGMYGGSVVDTENAKTNIKNQYDIYSTQQSYGNRQGIENMSYAQRANTIAELLRSGRGTDAGKQLDVLIAELKSSPQYSEYSEAQLKSIACSVYQRATGENLVEAVKNNTAGSFTKGLMEGVPIIGTFFTDGTSKEDLLAKITDMPERGQDQFAKSAGATISGAATGAAVGIGISLLTGVKIGALFGSGAGPLGIAAGVLVGAIAGGVVGIVKSLTK